MPVLFNINWYKINYLASANYHANENVIELPKIYLFKSVLQLTNDLRQRDRDKMKQTSHKRRNYLYPVLIVLALFINKSKVNGNQFANESKYVCTTPICIQTAMEVLKNMDQSVNPCDNFYQFACGGFKNATKMFAETLEINSYTILHDSVIAQLKSIFEQPSKLNEPKPFTLVKKLYSMCMTSHPGSSVGFPTLRKIFSKTGEWPILEGKNWNESEFEWKKIMQKFMQLGLKIDEFLSFQVESDPTNSTRRMLKLNLPKLNVLRENLIRGFKDAKVETHYSLLVELSVYLGVDREFAESEARDVMNLKMEIANISTPNPDGKLYHFMTVTEIQKMFPSIDWLDFINSIISRENRNITKNEYIKVVSPKYIHDLLDLLSLTPKRIQANYVFLLAVRSLVDYLPFGSSELKRSSKCVEDTTSALDWAVNVLYVQNYFHEDVRQNTFDIVTNVKNALVEIIKTLDWLDEATRNLAIEKVSSTKARIGFQDEVLDNKNLEDYYAKLNFNSDSVLEAIKEVNIFKKDKEFGQLKQPLHETDWDNQKSAVNEICTYSFQRNTIHLPAAILRGSFFNKNRPHYMNYGAIAQIIAHEIVHGFDEYGVNYDKGGNFINWLTNKTNNQFNTKTDCFKNQYSAITEPALGINLNGRKTLNENIADNGGVKAAYLAYNKWVEENGAEPTLPGLNFTANQMFWISAANIWCSNEENESLRNYIERTTHSPPRYRVLVPFSNSDYFAKDFNCPLGSKMNPKHKCKLW